MRKTDEKQWRRTSPLAAIFYLGRIFKTISQNAIQTLVPGAAFLFAYEGDLMSRIVLGITALIVITVSLSFLRYWFFRYQIGHDSILIREGVLKKSQLDIKFSRIQAINTTQNFVFRPFNLVTVQLDTAGSAKKEGFLPAIKSELAEALRSRLKDENNDSTAAQDQELDETEFPEEILRLNNADMIRIGLSSNRALIFLALLGPLMEPAGNRIEAMIDESTVLGLLNGAGISIAGGVGLAVALAIFLLIFLATVSVVGSFLRYYRFRLFAEKDALRSTGGLLTRHEHSMGLKKIQSLRAIQNPVLRVFKRFRVHAKQASSGNKAGQSNNFVIPISAAPQLPQLGELVFGDEFVNMTLNPKSAAFQPISTKYIRSRMVLFGVLPVTMIVAFFAFLIGKIALIFLLWLPFCAIWVWNNYRKHGFMLTENGVVLRRGFLGFKTVAFLHRKVQRVSVTQTPLQERKGLATIRFYLASGSLRLPFVDVRMANNLQDYILFKVESSQLAWH